MTPAALASIPAGLNPWLQGYRFFGDNYLLNQPINTLPVSPLWNTLQAAIGGSKHLQLDSSYPNNVTANASETLTITGYPADSDKMPMPQTGMTPENGGDQHLFVLDQADGTMKEAFSYQSQTNVGSEAVWNVFSNIDTHPATVGSADAAGLPVMPFTAKYQDIVHRTLNYPIRFTLPGTLTAQAFIPPASHWASIYTDTTTHMPMGARLRLRSTFDCSSFSPNGQYLCGQLKIYGLVLADNGSTGFTQADTDPGWFTSTTNAAGNQEYLNDVAHAVFFSDLEMVNSGPVYTASSILTGPPAVISGSNPYTVSNATFAYIEGVGAIPVSDAGTALSFKAPSGSLVHAYNSFLNSEIITTAR